MKIENLFLSEDLEDQEVDEPFDAAIIDECDDIFETDEMPFYDMYHRLERDRALGRQEFYD